MTENQRVSYGGERDPMTSNQSHLTPKPSIFLYNCLFFNNMADKTYRTIHNMYYNIRSIRYLFFVDHEETGTLINGW